ncbi:hypothetical protein [Sphaerisporangium sp. TRM90804]|uniref:hypothetical protein n=1 Tax=Sphaerisporangium sp. TRM90804 TaxID=3031113 RepID=UPI00244C3F2B|nr:hypothetical protein [Sphaerisporangium sp. TRM90804]MDH2429173.1 hypothetical protein [Sphaerisporangium sp. TRM90804]
MNPLPQPARAIAEAATDAVAAAGAREPEAFERAAARLAALDHEQTGLVLGAVVTLLLQDQYPSGPAADDVQALVARCARSAAAWFPGVDPHVLVMLVAGALGLHQPDGDPFPLDGVTVAHHGPLLVADLLAASGHPLSALLDAAFADIRLTQTSDTP